MVPKDAPTGWLLPRFLQKFARLTPERIPDLSLCGLQSLLSPISLPATSGCARRASVHSHLRTHAALVTVSWRRRGAYLAPLGAGPSLRWKRLRQRHRGSTAWPPSPAPGRCRSWLCRTRPCGPSGLSATTFVDARAYRVRGLCVGTARSLRFHHGSGGCGAQRAGNGSQ